VAAEYVSPAGRPVPGTLGTSILLIRHGHTPAVGCYLAGRAAGVGLTTRGAGEAEALVLQLEGQPIDAIYSSPLERARLTAAPLARARGLEVRIDPGFIEVDFGEWTGLPFEALEVRPDWRAFNERRSLAVVPGGESPPAAQARAVSAVARIRRAHPGQHIAVVTHADVIRYVLLHARGASLDDVHTLTIAPGSVTRLP
jgi:broad specificity phosphatase PhoE